MTDAAPTAFEPDPSNLRSIRTALGHFGTGVTIVTCAAPDGPLAMTANSFASVSLEPPLVLWSPARKSARHDPFVEARHFAVHVLKDDQEDLARRAAASGRDFDGIELQHGAAGTPLLPDCLARFECLHYAAHPAGDHTIVLGQIEKVTLGTGTPLLFAQGAFGRFAEWQ
ncbi:flavin reductase family protein [Roseicyclus sp. F158]|uniref:Flavin reductase family protein n=1 Tax=Tropicimonas omnivorans TaxID=3075590 RepID=A0ABU3DE07_9RHOB|nr:flavin reductase family protein [Roseicyclus sp. F158]MDT0681934.1 flavin reductase family protein [Roseicyclus sp. F158]